MVARFLRRPGRRLPAVARFLRLPRLDPAVPVVSVREGRAGTALVRVDPVVRALVAPVGQVFGRACVPVRAPVDLLRVPAVRVVRALVVPVVRALVASVRVPAVRVVLALVALVAPVALVPAVPVVLARAVPVDPAVVPTDSVVRRERSRGRGVVASSRNCSRSSRRTPRATPRCPRESWSSNAARRRRSSLPN